MAPSDPAPDSDLASWLDRLDATLPSPGSSSLGATERAIVLDLARVAAHRGVRVAAPMTTYLAGMAFATLSAEERRRGCATSSRRSTPTDARPDRGAHPPCCPVESLDADRTDAAQPTDRQAQDDLARRGLHAGAAGATAAADRRRRGGRRGLSGAGSRRRRGRNVGPVVAASLPTGMEATWIANRTEGALSASCPLHAWQRHKSPEGRRPPPPSVPFAAGMERLATLRQGPGCAARRPWPGARRSWPRRPHGATPHGAPAARRRMARRARNSGPACPRGGLTRDTLRPWPR
jgi:hypothetical protein